MARRRRAGIAVNQLAFVFARQLLPMLGYRRPTRREDCLPGGFNEMRPCPFVACRYSLLFDVDEDGEFRYYTPLDTDGLPVIDEKRPSCALDMADAGPQTLDSLSKLYGISLEAIRQVELRAQAKNRRWALANAFETGREEE